MHTEKLTPRKILARNMALFLKNQESYKMLQDLESNPVKWSTPELYLDALAKRVGETQSLHPLLLAIDEFRADLDYVKNEGSHTEVIREITGLSHYAAVSAAFDIFSMIHKSLMGEEI